jgi:F-type H+-transporting ATPase subunit alpha
MKKVAGGLKLDLAAYRELEAFAQLGTELDKATQKQLDRGSRLVELLKQAQYHPMPIEQEVMMIFAGTRGYLDDVAISRVQEFQKAFLDYVDTRVPDLRSELKEKADLKDVEEDTTDAQGKKQKKKVAGPLEKKLQKALDDFKSSTWKK